MSCIRFNTPAQLAQLRAISAAVRPTDDSAPVHPSPAVTESKIQRLRTLATHENSKIRESVASSYHAPTEVFAALAADSDDGVRSCIARNESVPCDILRSLASDSSERVRGFLALNFYVPADVMDQLASDESATVRGLVEWKSALASA
jgi:hypothetical protein